jgi:type II secretory pathway component PulM
MDWSRIGRAFVAMDVDSLKLAFDAWPNFDRRYFDQTEQVYQRWLSEMREAGIVSPTGLVICLVWLYGLLWARLPSPLRWAAMLVTLVWVAGALRAGASKADMPA